jgi:hypothetical protein
MTFTARTETYTNVSSLSGAYDVTVTKPTGTVDGDMLFQAWATQGAPGAAVDSVPAGWNLVFTRLVSSAYRFYLYWKVAYLEGASWVWSFTGSSKVRGVCSCYTGDAYLGGAAPIDVYSDTQYITADTILRAASMNVASANSPLVFWGFVYHTSDEDLTEPTVPDVWTLDDEGWHTTSDYAWIVCSMVWTGSGATGNMDAAISASDAHKHAFAVALKPAAPASGRQLFTLINMEDY